MKTVLTLIAFLSIVVGVAAGIYIGLGLLVGGVMDIVDSTKAPVGDAWTVAGGIVKIMLAYPIGVACFVVIAGGLFGTAVASK